MRGKISQDIVWNIETSERWCDDEVGNDGDDIEEEDVDEGDGTDGRDVMIILQQQQNQ